MCACPPLPALAAAGLVLASLPAAAEEWLLDRRVEARVSRNDNVNMQQNNPEAATVVTLAPSLNLTSRSETREVAAALGIGGNRYVGQDDGNAIDHNAGLSAKWMRELDQFALSAASVRNSTTASELAATGVVTVRRQRTQRDLQGQWAHGFDETTFGSLSAQATQVRYQQGPGLVDFNDGAASLGLGKALSERLSLSAALTARDFRLVGGAARTRVDGISVGGKWRHSERLGLALDAGRQRTRSEQNFNVIACQAGGTQCFPVSIGTESDTAGSTFVASADYAAERGSFAANVSRGLTASGTGSLLRTDAGGVSAKHSFAERLSVSIGASMTRSRYLDNPDATSRFTNLSASLEWQLDQWSSLSAGLSRATQRGAGQTDDTRAHVVFINLRWGFSPLSPARLGL